MWIKDIQGLLAIDTLDQHSSNILIDIDMDTQLTLALWHL